MREDHPIITWGRVGDACSCGKEVIGLELDIFGKEVQLSIGVGKGQASLADIVPLARTLSARIIAIVLENTRPDGDPIACSKGCSACCGRCLVPLSVPEAFRLMEDVSAVPGHRRESIWRNCLSAARRILSQEPPKPFTSPTADTFAASPVDLNLVSDWYESLKLACPFLHNRLCTVYEQRPLACREYFIRGSAEACGGRPYTAELVEMPVQAPNALAQLASELEGTSVEAIMLPLALIWCEGNAGRAERTWPAVMIVERFVAIVQAMALKNSPTVAV